MTAISKLSPDITSYDLFKCVAVIAMVIDHLGYVFFPDRPELRVIGRMAAPMFFFLIGFSKTRTLDTNLFVGAVLLIATDIVVGQPFFPLNILVTMIVYRLMLSPLERWMAGDGERIALTLFLLLVLGVPTAFVFDYGLTGLLFALIGIWCRRGYEAGSSTPFSSKAMAYGTMAIAAGGYAVLQLFVFFQNFTEIEKMSAVALLSLVLAWMVLFLPRVYPGTGRIGFAPIRFLGRQTLWIYVAHLVVFKLAALWMGLTGYQMFHFHWFN